MPGKTAAQRKKGTAKSKPKAPGRPSKIDMVIGADGLTVFQSIVRDLEVGAYLRDAAGRAGVHISNVQRWISEGEEWGDVELDEVPEGKRRYREFRDEVERARSQAVMTSLAVVRRAAQGTPAEYDEQGNEVRKERRPEWTAAAWYLERVRPEQFARTDRHEVTGKDGGPLTLQDIAAIAASNGSEDDPAGA